MFKFTFEIYDKRYHVWYQDLITYNIDIAEEYFNILCKQYEKGCVRMITTIMEKR